MYLLNQQIFIAHLLLQLIIYLKNITRTNLDANDIQWRGPTLSLSASVHRAFSCSTGSQRWGLKQIGVHFYLLARIPEAGISKTGQLFNDAVRLRLCLSGRHHKESYSHGCNMAAVPPDVTPIFPEDPKPSSPKALSFFLGRALPNRLCLLPHWSEVCPLVTTGWKASGNGRGRCLKMVLNEPPYSVSHTA